MEFLKDNAPVILTVLLLVILVLIVLILLLNGKLVKNLVSKRFSFHDLKEVDKDTNRQNFSIIVANRSLSDIAVNAIGVVSGLKFFDFQKNYRERKKLSEDNKPVIPQRASIKVSIGIEELETLIFSNVDKEKLSRTCVYVIDSSGNMSKCRARNFHKILKADYQALLKAKRAEKKREEFGKVKSGIASREAQGLPVSICERIKLVFAKFPKGQPAVPETSPASEAESSAAEKSFATENLVDETKVNEAEKASSDETKATAAEKVSSDEALPPPPEDLETDETEAEAEPETEEK